jgi:hypothetical protein
MIPADQIERLRAIARGYITAVHGRDWLIHNVNEEGVAFQMPNGAKGSSACVRWWQEVAWMASRV